MLSTNVALAQDTLRGWRIMIEPTQALYNNYPLTIETFNSRRSIGLSVAARPARKGSGEVNGGSGLFGDYELQNMINPLYSAATIGANWKPEIKRGQLDFQVFYRLWWIDDKQMEFFGLCYSINTKRTERQQVAGIKVFRVHTLHSQKNKRYGPHVELAFGAGARYKRYQFQTYDGVMMADDCHQYVPVLFLEESGSRWLGSAHLALRLGLNLNRMR